ncbi:MAG: hypothetical protein QJQ54_00860 [Mollicutes bacterium]|nr:MAG: hypothetical protein QJQ54_00860 [Mollicutes bacterium]
MPKSREVIDPSDSYFLAELQNLSTIKMNDFYKDINNMFLFSQFPTNFRANNDRFLYNDFFAVYTAELIRFLMVDYNSDP